MAEVSTQIREIENICKEITPSSTSLYNTEKMVIRRANLVEGFKVQ